MENGELTVFQKLRALKFGQKTGKHAPKSDREFVRLLQEGEAEDDIDKIYQFVEACERGPGLIRDYSMSVALQEMLTEALDENPEELRIILLQKSFLEQCILVSVCTVDMILAWIQMGIAENPRFLYECLRNVLYRCDKLEGDAEEIFIQGLVTLSGSSEELWKRWIIKHEYRKQWQRLLDGVLPRLQDVALLTYINTLNLGHHDVRNRDISLAIQRISDQDMRHMQAVIGVCLYHRWKEYLEVLRQKKVSQRQMVSFDYKELIMAAIKYVNGEQEQWEQEVTAAIDLLLSHMNEWYRTYTEIASVFWTDITQIVFLMQAGEELKYQPGKRLEEKAAQLDTFIERNAHLLKM